MRRAQLIVIAIFFSLLITSCGLVKVVYNNADTALIYVIDDWVDLSKEQRKWLKPRLTHLLAWHRSNELPQIQHALNEALVRSHEATTITDVRNVYQHAQQTMARTAEEILPDAVELLSQLGPEQIAHLEKKLAKDNQKITKEIARPLKDRHEKRIERYINQYEDWMGSLTEPQLTHIKQHVAALPFIDSMRSADRERWQRELIKLLHARPDAETFKRELRILLLYPESRRDPSYQSAWAAHQQEVIALTAWMVSNATAKQKVHLQKKLSGYADAVTGLLSS